MRIYRAVVTREEGRWLADVPEVPGAHTYARSLRALHRAVREVVTLMADYPDSAVEDETAFGVEFDFELAGELGRRVAAARVERENLREAENRASEATQEAVDELARERISVRDGAELIGMSLQRVQQLRASHQREAC